MSTKINIENCGAAKAGGFTGRTPHAQMAPANARNPLAPASNRKRPSRARLHAASGTAAFTHEIPTINTETKKSWSSTD